MQRASEAGEAKIAMGRWLGGFDWNLFATLTFKNPCYSDAIECAKSWLAYCSRRFGKTVAFIAEEVHKDRYAGKPERLHLHALVMTEDRPDAEALWSWWWRFFGRAKIEEYDPSRGAAKYISKYLMKEVMHKGRWALEAYAEGKPLNLRSLRRLQGTTSAKARMIAARFGGTIVAGEIF